MPARSRPCCWTRQVAAKLFSTPERCLKCKPPGLMRGQAFSSTHQVSGTFSLLSLKWSDFAWPCKRPFWRGLPVMQVSGNECRVSNLTHCCDVIAVLMVVEDAWNAWRCCHLLCYYLNWITKVMKLRVWFSETCQNLCQLLRNSVLEGLMGTGMMFLRIRPTSL